MGKHSGEKGTYSRIIVFVTQQFVGINIIMYYSPTIVQLAGFASNSTALALSLITSGLNVVGSIISMMFVDRYGRRRLMLLSMCAIITCLVVLTGLVYEAAKAAPKISQNDTKYFNSIFLAYASSLTAASWSCTTCLRASKECAFCANCVNQFPPEVTSLKS